MPQPLSDPMEVIDNANDQTPPPEAPPAAEAAPTAPDIPPVPPAPQELDNATIEGIPVAKYMELKHRERATQERIRQLEQQLEQRQRPQGRTEVPDPLVDPQGYADYLQQFTQAGQAEIHQAIQEERYAGSSERARDSYGDEVVDAAIQAFEDLPEGPEKRLEWQRFHSTRHPWGALVKWHEQKQLLDAMQAAGDPDAWVMQKYAEIQARKAAGNGSAAPNGAPPRPANSPPPPGTPFKGGPKRAPAPSLSNAPPSVQRTSPTLSGPGASFDSVFK